MKPASQLADPLVAALAHALTGAAARPAGAPTPIPAPGAGGSGGPGHGWVARVLTDPSGLVHAVAAEAGRLAAEYGAAAAAVAAATTAASLLVRGWVRARRRARWAEHARLVTVTPPPQVDPSGGPALWGHLVGLLRPAWARTLYGQPHLGFEYTWTGPDAAIQVWVPGVVPPGLIEAAIAAAWPGAHTTTRPAVGGPVPAGQACTGGQLRLARTEALPLATGQDADPLRAVFGAATGLAPGEHACVQVLARPAAGRRVRAARRAARRLQAGQAARPAARVLDLLTPGPTHRPRPTTASQDPQRAADARAATGKLAEPVWEARILYAVTHPAPESGDRLRSTALVGRAVNVRGRLHGNAHALVSGFALYTGRNFLVRRHLRHPARALARRYLHRGDLLSVSELAALAHLPLDAATPGLARAGARAVAPPPAVPTTAPAPHTRPAVIHGEGAAVPPHVTGPGPTPTDQERLLPDSVRQTPGHGGRRESGEQDSEAAGGVKVLGDTDTGPRRGVGLTVADARHHLHVIGATGSGKSTLLANLILDDARAGRGVLLIDPKGDLVTDLLDRLPLSVADRLTVIDPDDPATPPCLNPLDPAPGADLDTAVDNLVGIFRRIYTAYWGPRTDDVARAAALTLLHPRRTTGRSDRSRPELTDVRAVTSLVTLADIPRLLADPDYRTALVADIDDEVLAGFWTWYERLSPAGQAHAAGPLLNKLRAFLLRPFVAATIAAGPATLDLDAVLDGGVCLVRLPKGVLGEETARLLGSFVVARAWQAAAARARTGRPRRDAGLYLDEAHNFLNLPYPVEDMLAEARGYRLSLTLAHQNLAQLPRDLREGISANARNKIFFNASPEDARDLQRHTAPRLVEHDLSHLAAFQAAARLVAGSAETPAFTLRTRPLPPPIPGRESHLRRATAGDAAGRPNPSDRRVSARRTPVPTDPRTQFRTGPTAATSPTPVPAAGPEPAERTAAT